MFRGRTLLGCTVFALAIGSSALSSAALVGERAHPSDHPDWPVVQVSPEVRMARAAIIRDAAAEAGMFNAVLLAGIGEVETGFAHCWSEATWACQGPASSSCEGGPVIAGASDGPCSEEQGGLGMFQFDSGTFTDTINTYGADIVTMEGNVSAVVPFLVTRAMQSIEGVDTEDEALAWMNSIPVVAGDPRFEEWIYFVSWRYNGCQGCSAQEAKYRDGTLLLLEEMGAEFWMSSAEDPCQLIPSAGATIEEDDDCYRAYGSSTYWRDEAAGHGGALQWTKTTSSDSPDNYGVWRLRFEQAAEYQVEVYSDGGTFGMSKQAAYEITHKGATETLLVDQSASTGWISLGSFDFDTSEGYQLRLNDNTGEPWAEEPGGTKIMFDAVRVTRVGGGSVTDPEGEGQRGDTGSFCSVSGGKGASAWPLLLALLAIRGRRRR